jgi:hypothetical protein
MSNKVFPRLLSAYTRAIYPHWGLFVPCQSMSVNLKALLKHIIYDSVGSFKNPPPLFGLHAFRLQGIADGCLVEMPQEYLSSVYQSLESAYKTLASAYQSLVSAYKGLVSEPVSKPRPISQGGGRTEDSCSLPEGDPAPSLEPTGS